MLEELKQQCQQNGEVYLRVKVRPNAAETALKEVLADETIKIDVAAPAERGKANAELIRFLAGEFGVAKENVRIISGAGERVKLVKIKI
jgi:hypothetical protein